MASDYTRGIKVYLDSQQYGKSMQQMTAKLRQYRRELEALIAAGNGGTKEADRARQKIVRLETVEKKYREEMRETERVLRDLSGATYNQLFQARNRLRAQLREMVPGTREYNMMLETLRQTETRLQAVTGEMNAVIEQQRGLFSRLSSALNKYFLIISTAVSSVLVFVQAGRKAVEAYSEVEEALAKIRKYAGLTTEEVHALSRELGDVSRIDTRTSHLALLELAADAGRLGIKGTKNLRDFVVAADKLNLSLGEDLGEGAVTEIGKLANLFGEDKRIGLEEAMLSTGSAVTRLAKSSTACEPYLVSFASRLGGIGAVAGITTGDILGLGSALDQNMQKVEMSSTALSTLITKIFQEPAKFAQLAGIEVTEFTRMVREDANEALLQFLQAMQQKGGFDQLAPMFQEMEMSGKRAVQVLSTLASHVDQVREAQQIANAAYAENIEVEHEFAIINDTVEARLEKRKKQLQQLRLELGERLLPVMVHVRTAQSLAVRTLKQVTDFTVEHRAVLTATLTTLAAYTMAVRLASAASKLQAFWTDKVVVALRRLKTAISTNPFGALLTALAAVVGLMVDATRRAGEFARSLVTLEGITRSAARDTEAEAVRLKALLAVLADDNSQLEARIAAINDLRAISPEYLGALDAERTQYDEAAMAVNRYIKYIKLKNQLDKAVAARDELSAEMDELKEKAEDTSGLRKAWLYSKRAIGNLFSSSLDGEAALEQVRRKVDRDIWGDFRLAEERIRELDALIEETQRDILSLETETVHTVKETVVSEVQPFSVEDVKELYEGDGGLLEAEEREHELMLEALKMQLARREIAQDEYNVRESALMAAHYTRLVALYDAYRGALLSATAETEKERETALSKVYASREKAARSFEKAMIDSEDAYHDAMDRMQRLSQRSEPDAYEKIDEEYRQRVKLAADYYAAITAYIAENVKDIRAYVEMASEAKAAYEAQLTELARWKDEKVRGQEVSDLKERNRTVQRYLEQTLRQQYEMELSELDAYHERGLFSEEEYQRARMQLQLSYVRQAYDSMAGYASGVVSALQEAEIAAVEEKYEILIREAENAGQDTAELETAQANEKLEIEKRYALSDLLVKLSQITADTAVAIMTGFAQLGPVGGAAAAAMLAATGIAQYATAFAEYRKIRDISLESGGTSATAASESYERVTQYASGRYDVIGEETGKVYRGIPYIGRPETGVLDHPALVSESGAELIVSAPDLARLRAHVNYPLVVDAIRDARTGHVPQHESGSYAPIDGATHARQQTSSVTGQPVIETLLREIAGRIDSLPRETRSYVLLDDVNRATELKARAEAPFRRTDRNR